MFNLTFKIDKSFNFFRLRISHVLAMSSEMFYEILFSIYIYLHSR